MQTMNHYSVNLWYQQVQNGYPQYDRPADASHQVYAAKEEEAVKECSKALGWSSVYHAEVFDLSECPMYSYHVFDDYPHCLERIGQSGANKYFTAGRGYSLSFVRCLHSLIMHWSALGVGSSKERTHTVSLK